MVLTRNEEEEEARRLLYNGFSTTMPNEEYQGRGNMHTPIGECTSDCRRDGCPNCEHGKSENVFCEVCDKQDEIQEDTTSMEEKLEALDYKIKEGYKAGYLKGFEEGRKLEQSL